MSDVKRGQCGSQPVHLLLQQLRPLSLQIYLFPIRRPISSLTAARQQINIRKYRRHRSLVVPNKTDRSFSCDHTIIYKWWPAEFAHTLIELLPEAVIHSLNWVERRALIRKRRLTVRQFTNYSVGNVGLCDVTAHWHSIMQDNSFQVQLVIFSISTVSHLSSTHLKFTFKDELLKSSQFTRLSSGVTRIWCEGPRNKALTPKRPSRRDQDHWPWTLNFTHVLSVKISTESTSNLIKCFQFRNLIYHTAEQITDRAIHLTDVNNWLRRIRLRLNASKTHVIWLGSNQQLDKIDIRVVPIMTTCAPVLSTVRDLGVIFDIVWPSRPTKFPLTVDPAISCARYALSRGHCQLKVPMQWSTHLFHVVWTTVTRCWLRSVMSCSGDYSQYRMLLLVFLHTAMSTHYAGIEATALVACSPTHPLQADDSGAPGIIKVSTWLPH